MPGQWDCSFTTRATEVASEIAILNAELTLRNSTYVDGQDFIEFITQMRTKWSNATALGAPIDDKSFRTIILNALPRTWDPIVATLYTTQSSRDAAIDYFGTPGFNHYIENCYWPGGGKAGQFPPGFGKRGGARGSAAPNNSTSQTSANAVTTSPATTPAEPQVFALAAITEMENTTKNFS
ncbi:hypothetical protein AGABI2DRAFT_139406 [Agaricus bisporus var. bisporus H97]|uniref:hypothetical protein n=1 Tax=Agaricus bisporus var. bisporus (strain H97 / ATCC MYA-4626 / FGSC 10389) TaxID=936046 RepID=UPI00029F57FA|nr:hypothetical protein AGABI2DRAFT_139406 [Agaricus bisporus var. bisporus H97]EKV42421.1 hypothetical protein AGABI2DRAFT_139406 [Agaricus bisporus var. bisporus H97]